MAGSSNRALVASYRFQLTPSHGFDAVAALLHPLRRLGVSHVYLSPIAEAIPGSAHGYDVVDHRAVRAEFGGEAALTRLLDRAADLELGVIVDHVPNHASVARAELNPWWWEMLRDGADSAAASWFDVDWELTGGKVVVPKLGEPAHDLLETGRIEVGTGALGPELRVGSMRFPLAPGTEHLAPADAIEAQHYLLTWWRDPMRNVRRFFTVDDLVAVRVEHGDVAAVVDTLPRRLVDHPAFAGVRVDHIDGLADPERYLDGLRETVGDRWLLVEKILGPGERLPASWPVDGTTGYEHLTVVEHLMLDPAALDPLDALWVEAVAADDRVASPGFDDLERAARVEVLDGGLLPDLQRLVRVIASTSVLAVEDAHEAVVAFTLALDRYRTYLPDDEPSAALVTEIERSLGRDRPDLADRIGIVAELIRSDDGVRARWQQLTGPVMAKGAEDRAFYRHQRLSSLCEVGGRPGTWTLDVADLHAHEALTQASWPTTMLAAGTHDTKRSEAVRARSLALATMADDWATAARAWFDANGEITEQVGAVGALLALQTAVTAQPLTVDRLHDYLIKAAREAELRTDWHDPDAAYEEALRRLAAAILTEVSDSGTQMAGLADRVERRGVAIGLRLLALQSTCPGVPDLYQGAPAELTALVDPDNRHPPDWAAWQRLVERATDTRGGPLDMSVPDLARTRLVAHVLGLRRRHPGAFGPQARYAEILVSGPDADRVVAFSRCDATGRPAVVVVVVRPASDTSPDPNARLSIPDGTWSDLIDRSSVESGASELLAIVGDTGFAVLEHVG